LLEKANARRGKIDFAARRAISHAIGEIAMKSTNHKSKPKSSQPSEVIVTDPLPPMLRPHCGIWAEPGRVEIMFRLDTEGTGCQHIIVDVPPKDGSLPEVRGTGAASIPVFAKVEQAARLCGFRPKTFYNWIEAGKLRTEHGLRKFGRECRIEWKTFKAAVDRGEVPSCS